MTERLYKVWELESKPAKASRGGARRRVEREYTEQDVFDRLKFAFPSPAFVLLPQVRSCTGQAQDVPRKVDAIAASVYPSRGLYLCGIEIKVKKTDWRKELRDPEKSEAIKKYCRYWYVAAPIGIVPVGELPEGWGLVEVRADGATIVHRAEKTVEEPVDIGFVCSVLRAAAGLLANKDDDQGEVKAAMDEADSGDDRTTDV